MDFGEQEREIGTIRERKMEVMNVIAQMHGLNVAGSECFQNRHS